MAASTIDDSYIVLYSLIHGPKLNVVPLDGFTGGSHHNVESASYPVGCQVEVYDKTNLGPSVFTYAKVVHQLATTYIIAAKDILGTYATTPVWYELDNDQQTALPGQAFIAISAMTTNYYGWFWTGGVCPVSFVSALDGNYRTADALVASSTSGFVIADYGTNNQTALGPSSAEIPMSGYTLAADA